MFTATLAFPSPQKDDDDAGLTETEKCGPAEFETFLGDFKTCELEASAVIDKAFARGLDIPSAFCNSIAQMVR